MVTLKKLSGILAFSAMLATAAFSQTKNDAINLYNQGIGLMKTDIPAAISTFENCAKMCTEIGDSAAQLKEKAQNLIPDLYYQKAYKIYATDKKVPESIQAAKEAQQVAEKYNSAKTKEKLEKFFVQAYIANGTALFKAGDNANALKAFDSALLVNPNYYKAIFNKANVYRKMDNPTLFAQTIDLYIDKVKAENDTLQLAQANKLAVDYLRSAGNKANQANKLADACALLTGSFKYGSDKDVLFNLADVYNKQKKYDDALANAQKGLDMETGTVEAKAKFYYEIAVAQAGKGEKDNACASFKNALYGQFAEPSKAQMTNLKCPK